jgi:NAD+ synthetase
VLATGNKSELSIGYCTLYGDTVGGLAVLGDVYKRDVYALARHANRHGERIPASTIEKPPSAELAPDQRDEDDLPPYAILDAVLEQAIEGGGTPVDRAAGRRIAGWCDGSCDASIATVQAPPVAARALRRSVQRSATADRAPVRSGLRQRALLARCG